MKYVIVLLVGAFYLSCQSREEKAIEPTYLKVKSVLESLHDPIGKLDALEYDESVSEDSFMSELHFNKKGQLVKESRFDSNGTLRSTTTFKYDRHGNNIRADVYTSNGFLVSSTLNSFDPDNGLIERNEVDANDQVISRQRQEHSEDGYRWMVTYKKSKGRLVKTLESVFNEKGNNILNNFYTQETLKKKDIHTYDVNSGLVQTANLVFNFATSNESTFEKKTANYQNDGTLKTSEKHQFDAEGNRIETIQYFPLSNSRITTRYKYDKTKMEVVTLLSNKMISSKKIVRYDARQNIIESFRYGLGGRLEEHQRHLYEYDAAGNWTKHKTIINNKSISLTLRQIEYF